MTFPMKVKSYIQKFNQQFNAEHVKIHQTNCRYQGFFRIDEYLVSHQLFNGGESKILSREILSVVMPWQLFLMIR